MLLAPALALAVTLGQSSTPWMSGQSHVEDLEIWLVTFSPGDMVNDWWGHAAGDACLVAFGDRLRKAFPKAHLVSRIGGDEFAVLLPPVNSRRETEIAVRKLIRNLRCPVPWNGDLLPLGVSVGIAFASEQTEFDPQRLFAAADRALYNAKKDASTFLVCA